MKRNNLVRTLVSLVALVTMLCSMMSIAYAEAGGLTVIDSMELKYASGFSVDYCEGGYKIITDGIGKQFLLVPEGAEIPETDMIVLQAPLTKLGCFSTTHAVPLKALDKLDLVTMVTTKRDSWHMQQIKDVIKEGNVWGMSANYWQCADDAAGMIEELYTIMHHPEEATDLKYYFKLEG